MSEARGAEAPQTERRSAETHRGTSWSSVIFGWLAALGAGLILSGIVAAVVGAILGMSGAAEGGVSGLVGVLITLFLAFLIGGYVAGRMAGRSGLKHGLLVPLLSLIITIVLGLLASAVGTGFIDQLGGVTLPQGAQRLIPQQNLGTILTVTGLIALIVPFIGGAIGGPWGARRTIPS